MFVATAVLVSTICFSVAMGLQIRLCTHNIRFATENPFPNEKLWDERKPILLKELRHITRHPETFVMLQEALINQLEDIVNGLNEADDSNTETENKLDWTYYGLGRNPGGTSNEYSPILYRPSVWQLKDSDTVWLCPPDKQHTPGESCWGAKLPRILSIARFKHIASGRQLVVLNTHLDNDSDLSRNNSVGVIQDKIREWTDVKTKTLDSSETLTRLPVVLGGDFNSLPSMGAYKLMTSSDSLMKDLKTLASPKLRYGCDYTYTGFNWTMKGWHGPPQVTEVNPPQLIDFLFLGPKGEDYWKVNGYAVLPNVFDDGVFMSDHRAVVGDIELLPEKPSAFVAQDGYRTPEKQKPNEL